MPVSMHRPSRCWGVYRNDWHEDNLRSYINLFHNLVLFVTILTYFMVVLIASPATAFTAVCLALIFYFAMGKPIRLKKNLAEKV